MYLIGTSASCVCQEMTVPCKLIEVVKDGNVLKHMEASCTLQALNANKSHVTAYYLSLNTAKMVSLLMLCI